MGRFAHDAFWLSGEHGQKKKSTQLTAFNIVGVGNVGSHMAVALRYAGYPISTVYNRTSSLAEVLAKKVKAKVALRLSSLDKDAVTLICVSDDAIASIACQIIDHFGNNHRIVHTSGIEGVDLQELDSSPIGCIWPVQSIKKEIAVDFSSIPLCVDASNEKLLKRLLDICKNLSRSVIHLPSEKKKYIHLSAVWANNFSNHLIHLAEKICAEQKISRKVLYPLLSNMIDQINNRKAYDIQTGPARRKDLKTIEKHLELMEDKKLKDLYRHLSESIIYTYHENN